MEALDKKSYLKLVERFPLQNISSAAYNERALAVLAELARKDTDMSPGELIYFRALTTLVEEYERQIWNTQVKSKPLDILQFCMEQHGLKPVDLWSDVIKSNLSQFMSGKRSLSKNEAARLGARFNIDPNLLVPRIEVQWKPKSGLAGRTSVRKG